MTIHMKWLRLWKPKNSTQTWKIPLHAADRFDEILRCERMRSDRSGMPFCTVVFKLDTTRDAECQAFIDHILSRMRVTDHIGLLNETDVAVVLWDTTKAGAQSYLQVVDEQKRSACVVSTKIHIYPSTESHIQSRLRNDQADEEKQPTCDPAKPVVEPLEVLFIKKLPLWKRIVDISGATIGLVLLSPLLLATAFLIKLTSRGPVLFKQQRDGLGGKRFTIYKFRTMRINAEQLKDELRKHSEQDGPAFKLTNDPRITPIGKFLRKSCVDELPQLWNVIKGDMTLVGPRPLDSKEAEKILGWGRRRLEVTPGLTCIWQVHGKSRVPFNEWMRMDIRYSKKRTLRKDLKLIWETIVAVVTHRASV